LADELQIAQVLGAAAGLRKVGPKERGAQPGQKEQVMSKKDTKKPKPPALGNAPKPTKITSKAPDMFIKF
jgi:hypothetical protein